MGGCDTRKHEVFPSDILSDVRKYIMCDTEKYNIFAEEILNMDLTDLKRLILEATSDDQRDLYFKLYEHVLQKRQKEVLKEHVF